MAVGRAFRTGKVLEGVIDELAFCSVTIFASGEGSMRYSDSLSMLILKQKNVRRGLLAGARLTRVVTLHG